MASQVSLWVRTEPLSYGPLPTAPHPRLNHVNLKKIVLYARGKQKDDPHNLTYSMWRHVACNKLGLPEQFAWIYFQLFLCLSESVNEEWELAYMSAQSDEKRDELRRTTSVALLPFVVFLYCHQLYKISLRQQLVSGEEWPSEGKNHEMDSRQLTPREQKVLDDNFHNIFILQHIVDIVEIVMEGSSVQGNSRDNDKSITLDGLHAIGFIIAGSVFSKALKDHGDNVLSLVDILLMKDIQSKLGYSKSSKTFSAHLVLQFIRAHLILNPHGVSSCLSSGMKLNWGEECRVLESGNNQSRRGKVISNINLLPTESSAGNTIVFVSQVVSCIMGRAGGDLEGVTLKISQCRDASLYLLNRSRCVTVDRVRRSLVMLGVVDGVLHIHACEKVTVIACARQIVISQCTDCTFYIFTVNHPIILSSSRLIMSPYHTNYSLLGVHLADAKMVFLQRDVISTCGLWDKSIYFSLDEGGTSSWEPINPEDLIPFSCALDLSSAKIPVPAPGMLPPEFVMVLRHREEQLARIQRDMKDKEFSDEQQELLSTEVQKSFQHWIFSLGLDKELSSLA